jgi:hypothetical protein
LNTGQRSLAKRLGVIARSEATKQSSAREARQLKSTVVTASSALFARLPARSWIASLCSQ